MSGSAQMRDHRKKLGHRCRQRGHERYSRKRGRRRQSVPGVAADQRAREGILLQRSKSTPFVRLLSRAIANVSQPARAMARRINLSGEGAWLR